MSYQVSVRKKGDKFLAGIDAEGACQASADTPIQALRKCIQYFGMQVVKYYAQEITIERLAEKIGVSEAEVLEIAEIETLLPPPLTSRVASKAFDKN